MSASKSRPRWADLPDEVRGDVESLLQGVVVAAANCPGGYSPGFASRLTLADGRPAFVKAVDSVAWPIEGGHYRSEMAVAAGLPATVPAPRLLGTRDDGRWVMLAFEHVDGAEPRRPWRAADLDRVIAAVAAFAGSATTIDLSRDHPRLGGWAEIARDPTRGAALPAMSRWAADNLPSLVRWEHEGLVAAQGDTLVHFDLYPHNVLLTADRVVLVDWPHARLGAPVIDPIAALTSAAAEGIDPEPVLRRHFPGAGSEWTRWTAVLAAHTGFLLAGALAPPAPGLEAITDAKRHLATGGLRWLRQRLQQRRRAASAEG
jgi:Phosphotransferase enzyme family